ncbi:hypothetical protein KQH90_03665 [Anaerosalibacter bizertensis]|uniref:hypothetical protein n=1 Tax=Anaerosalibacter bizertensis TaxID=932217 RepID=UPI001C0E9284|nr:hypothetical protein [Anaerosalibacter bizertensis]MBU5293134.1 hypothetical protein [Anaerosalibacter bizertensis]
MNLSEKDIKESPIYKEAFIAYRAKLDEDDRRARIENEKKRKAQRKELIINSIFGLIVYLMIRFMLLKPIFDMI